MNTFFERAAAAGIGMSILLTASACAGGQASGDGKETVTVGVTPGVPPYIFSAEGSSSELIGYEPELLREAAGRIGVELDFQEFDFASLFAAVDAGRVDIAAGGIIDRKARQQKYDMVDYTLDASNFLGRAGTFEDFDDMTDLCGDKVAVVSGNSYEKFMIAESDKCVKAGSQPINMVQHKTMAEAILSIDTGRANYLPTQIPLTKYAAEKNPKLQSGGPEFLKGYVAFALPKDSELTEPLRAALDEMMADGTYLKILTDADIENLAIEKSGLNNGTAE